MDIGTGCGCISISIKKKLHNSNNIYAIDISKKSINITYKNSLYHNVKIFLYKEDILKKSEDILKKSFFFSKKFDIIISNPPYITKNEKELMHPNVYHYEPNKALFVNNNDPIIFYKKIIYFSKKILKENGKLYLEINPIYKKKIINYLKYYNTKIIKIKKDFYEFYRMIKIIF